MVINVKDNDNAHIFAICSITADIQKFPIFLAQGDSDSCKESQIDDDTFPNVSTHSLISKCFIQYLSFLCEQFPGDSTSKLIVDSYSSYFAERSQNTAKKLNNKLIFIFLVTKTNSSHTMWLNLDISRIHNSAIIMQKTVELWFKQPPHPPYSPDLALSDFFLFSYVTGLLRGQKFNSFNELVEKSIAIIYLIPSET